MTTSPPRFTSRAKWRTRRGVSRRRRPLPADPLGRARALLSARGRSLTPAPRWSGAGLEGGSEVSTRSAALPQTRITARRREPDRQRLPEERPAALAAAEYDRIAAVRRSGASPRGTARRGRPLRAVQRQGPGAHKRTAATSRSFPSRLTSPWRPASRSPRYKATHDEPLYARS